MTSQTIVLIGAMCAGKSTIAERLAQKLDMPYVELDDLRWDYYGEIGYDQAEASRRAAQEDGARAVLDYWKPFEAHAVERVLAQHGGSVIAFGAGHSVYEDEALFARVQKALVPCLHVILLLPSPDLDESVQVLNARFEQLLREEGVPLDPQLLVANEQFVRHESNFRLATMRAYTAGKTPEETAEEILRLMGPGAG